MKNIVSIPIHELNQLVNKKIFIGKMNIGQLTEIIKYTDRKSNPNDPFNEEVFEDSKKNYEHYQRVKNSDRAYQIKLFFLKHIWNKYYFKKERISPLGTFPSSIILALNTNQDIQSTEEYNKYLKLEKNPDYIFSDNNLMYIPKSRQGLIVDGQHRIAGLELLLEEVKSKKIKINRSNQNDYFLDTRVIPPYEYIEEEISKFEFIITFLLDFDPYEQAEIFATVNFNQTKVNKSFYYDIFGSSTTLTVEKLLHDITSHLNYKEDSPLYGFIKMLGTGEGYFSQSFFVDAMLPHFKNGTFNFIFNDFKNKGTTYKETPKFLKCYFDVVLNDIFKDYLPGEGESKYKDILLKTTGMGAIIKLMPNVFVEIKKRNKAKSSDVVLMYNISKIKEEIKLIFDEIRNKGGNYFSRDSEFAKGAGKGLQNKLYDKMFVDLGLKKKNENEDQLTLL